MRVYQVWSDLTIRTVLSSEQFNSIIVHELAHLKLGNILLDIWMQRINDLYHKYIARENSKGARYVMVRFLKWYFPLIERYFFVLYRLGEIISDRNASNISGNSNYAKALIVSIIYNNAVSEFFWEPLLNATEVEFVIPQNVYTLMIAALHNPIPEVLIDQSIDTSFEVMSKYIDPHPSMQERITHLGFPPIYEDKHWIIATELIPKFLPQKSAADEYIGSFLPEIVQEMDNTWWIAHIEDLRNLYNRRKEAKTVVAAIVRGNEELVFNDANEAWRYASAVFNASGADEALPCLNHVISLDPNHMRCRMLLGSLLLQKGNSEGITHLRYAMENSLDYAWKACRMIYDYYVIKGQSSTADQYARWGKGFGERVEQAKNECLLGESPASYFPHDWTENEVETLKKELARYPYINRASLVRKDVSIFPGQQCYFLIVWQEGMLPMNIERHSETEIVSGLKKYLIFPHTTFIVYLDSLRIV